MKPAKYDLEASVGVVHQTLQSGGLEKVVRQVGVKERVRFVEQKQYPAVFVGIEPTPQNLFGVVRPTSTPARLRKPGIYDTESRKHIPQNAPDVLRALGDTDVTRLEVNVLGNVAFPGGCGMRLGLIAGAPSYRAGGHRRRSSYRTDL